MTIIDILEVHYPNPGVILRRNCALFSWHGGCVYYEEARYFIWDTAHRERKMHLYL
jgi:hypothetical protein